MADPVVPPVINSTVVPDREPASDAITIVGQWLTYVLWEWVVIVVGTALSYALTFLLLGDEDISQSFTITILASIVILTPIAFVVDWLYRKREPDLHHGFGAIVMVINAVLIFIAAIGGLIGAVISLLLLTLNPNSTTGTTISVIATSIFAVLNGLLFLRVIGRAQLRRYRVIYPFIATVIAVAAIVLTVVGPTASAYSHRGDRQLEDGLSALPSAIDSYYNSNHAMPAKLSELDKADLYSDSAKALIEANKVEYHLISDSASAGVAIITNTNEIGGSATARYQLCVNYQVKRGNGVADTSDYSISTRSHPAGRTCYELTTTRYNS